MKLAADIVEHKGPGQRRNRNRLAFLAPDQAALEDIQNVVRRKIAWASIVRDARGILQLPPAQDDDAKKTVATIVEAKAAERRVLNCASFNKVRSLVRIRKYRGFWLNVQFIRMAARQDRCRRVQLAPG